MTPVRAVIVDDEPLAVERLRRLARERGVDVVGHAYTGREALAIVQATEPDVVFLDVQLPDIDGVALAAHIRSTASRIVMVTAFDRYAVTAFDLCVTDYLLKPVSADRFGEAVDKVAAAGSRRRQRFLTRLPITERGRIRLVDTAAIVSLIAADNYVVVRVPPHNHVMRSTLSSLEPQLEPGVFARIHRSAIVNITRIQEAVPVTHGELRLTMDDGQRLRVSRSYAARVKRRLRGTGR
jgi:DNA-binding LytR/AlgR family response regulator